MILSELQISTFLFLVRPVNPNQQVRLQTSVTIPGLGTAVVQPNAPSVGAQVTIGANQTQTSTTANKILLPSSPVKVTSPEAKQILTSPTKVVTVTSKDGGSTQQFVLTNALKQQSMFLNPSKYFLFVFEKHYFINSSKKVSVETKSFSAKIFLLLKFHIGTNFWNRFVCG